MIHNVHRHDVRPENDRSSVSGRPFYPGVYSTHYKRLVFNTKVLGWLRSFTNIIDLSKLKNLQIPIYFDLQNIHITSFIVPQYCDKSPYMQIKQEDPMMPHRIRRNLTIFYGLISPLHGTCGILVPLFFPNRTFLALAQVDLLLANWKKYE